MASERKTNQTEPEFLNSWKEISSYMRRGVRTVQRYEVQYALPIRRPAGKSRSAVMATRAEIDAWVAAAPFRDRYELSKSPAKGRSAADVRTMKDAIEEMHKLQHQMTELRAEHHLALNLFMGSLDRLHRALGAAPQASYGASAKGTNLGWNSSSAAGRLAKTVA